MKLFAFILLVLLSFFFPFSESYTIKGQSNERNGNITGTVVLTARNSPARFGGRLYGRLGQASASEPSTDSVLVVLTGSQVRNTPPKASPVILDQKDQSFVPNLLPIRQNQEVRIRNSDPVYHNVFSLSSIKRFDVGRRPKGEHLDVTFDKPGIVDVFCDIHSNMHAVVYVMPKNTVSWAKLKSGQAFNLEDISPGNYELKVYARGYEEMLIPVEVTTGESLQLGTITMNP